jgi:hypothetical protein
MWLLLIYMDNKSICVILSLFIVSSMYDLINLAFALLVSNAGHARDYIWYVFRKYTVSGNIDKCC